MSARWFKLAHVFVLLYICRQQVAAQGNVDNNEIQLHMLSQGDWSMTGFVRQSYKCMLKFYKAGKF